MLHAAALHSASYSDEILIILLMNFLQDMRFRTLLLDQLKKSLLLYKTSSKSQFEMVGEDKMAGINILLKPMLQLK